MLTLRKLEQENVWHFCIWNRCWFISVNTLMTNYFSSNCNMKKKNWVRRFLLQFVIWQMHCPPLVNSLHGMTEQNKLNCPITSLIKKSMQQTFTLCYILEDTPSYVLLCDLSVWKLWKSPNCVSPTFHVQHDRSMILISEYTHCSESHSYPQGAWERLLRPELMS